MKIQWRALISTTKINGTNEAEVAARLNKWLNIKSEERPLAWINEFYIYFIAIKEYKLKLKMSLVMLIEKNKPQEIGIHWVFVQQNIKYPKKEPVSYLGSQYSPALP